MREPFLRISKRGSIALPHAWGIRVSSVILAMILGALFVVAVTGLNPLDVYASMYRGAFGTERNAWVTIREAMMLLCIGIGLAPAFKMKFWNIGAEGQVLVGAVCAAGLMIKIGAGLPNGLLLLLMAAAGMLGGAIWGIIPALFKAKWNSNETLFTLMMNYVAIQITSYCVALWENPRGSNKVGVINQMNKAGWFPKLFGQDYLLNVILVLLLAVFMFVYLKYSKQGFEIAVVGESTNTARYASIRISRVYMRTMALSGAICGLAGFIAVAGADYTISTSTADGRGFTAIIVAWLAKFNTFVMILISFLIVFLQRGASEIASDFNLNEEASNVITGIILFCIIGSEFFINYKTRLNRRKEDAK
jgi:simple sugar transport system permease protein